MFAACTVRSRMRWHSDPSVTSNSTGRPSHPQRTCTLASTLYSPRCQACHRCSSHPGEIVARGLLGRLRSVRRSNASGDQMTYACKSGMWQNDGLPHSSRCHCPFACVGFQELDTVCRSISQRARTETGTHGRHISRGATNLWCDYPIRLRTQAL